MAARERIKQTNLAHLMATVAQWWEDHGEDNIAKLQRQLASANN